MLNAILMMTILGLVMGLLLAVASQVFYVKVDERIEEVRKMLPGLDCGSCGYPGCNAFAEALCTADAKTVKLCRPSKPDARQAIAEYLNSVPDNDGNMMKVEY